MLIGGSIFVWQMKIPIERIHILEYGILGWFAGRDLVGKEKKIWGILLALIFVGLIGVLDEVFQAILPYRYFDLRDVGFNELGGVWGVVMYLLGTYPLKFRS
jgi:VanZ family protein